MNLRKKLLAAALAATLFPAAAFACDEDSGSANGYAPSAFPQPPPGVPVQQQSGGHYELRSVDRWVPGRYEKVWVPRSCDFRGRGRRVCTGGFHDRRWIAGRYERTQQQVWVADYRQGDTYRSYDSSYDAYRGASFRVRATF